MRMASSLAALAGLWAAAALAGPAVIYTKPADPKAPPPLPIKESRTLYFSKPADPEEPVSILTPPVARPAEPCRVRPPETVGTTTYFYKMASTPYQAPQPTIVQPVSANARLPQTQAGTIVPSAFQQPMGQDGMGTDTSQEYRIQLEPPGKRQLYQLDSEFRLQERLRQEAEQRPRPERILFPDEPVLNDPYKGRCFAPSTGIVEPFYVCYNPLLFEQRNSERWGWDLAMVQPLLSAGKFFGDVLLLPYKLGSMGRCPYECNTGYCLPGDPVPLRIFPVGLSFKGVLTEAGVAIALMGLFP